MRVIYRLRNLRTLEKWENYEFVHHRKLKQFWEGNIKNTEK